MTAVNTAAHAEGDILGMLQARLLVRVLITTLAGLRLLSSSSGSMLLLAATHEVTYMSTRVLEPRLEHSDSLVWILPPRLPHM